MYRSNIHAGPLSLPNANGVCPSISGIHRRVYGVVCRPDLESVRCEGLYQSRITRTSMDTTRLLAFDCQTNVTRLDGCPSLDSKISKDVRFADEPTAVVVSQIGSCAFVDAWACPDVGLSTTHKLQPWTLSLSETSLSTTCTLRG